MGNEFWLEGIEVTGDICDWQEDNVELLLLDVGGNVFWGTSVPKTNQNSSKFINQSSLF